MHLNLICILKTTIVGKRVFQLRKCEIYSVNLLGMVRCDHVLIVLFSIILAALDVEIPEDDDRSELNEDLNLPKGNVKL